MPSKANRVIARTVLIEDVLIEDPLHKNFAVTKSKSGIYRYAFFIKKNIAIVFLGVNYCILQYAIAFLATIAIAIVLRTIANALVKKYISSTLVTATLSMSKMSLIYMFWY